MTRRHIATKLIRIFYYLRNNHIFLAEDGEIERLIPTVDGHGINWVERCLKNILIWEMLYMMMQNIL
jgi:hypothetical protein